MSIEIKMPALSPTMEEGTLAKWLVKEGDTVSSGDLMAEIETDKATMEFEAVDEGVIAKILVPEGAEGVKVGDVIAILAEEGEDASAVSAPKGEAKSEAKAEAPKAEEKADVQETKAAEQKPAPAAPAAPAASGDRVKASPLARRIAADKGLDLGAVSGSGPNGRIVKADVEGAKAGAAPAAKAEASAPSAAPAPAVAPVEAKAVWFDDSIPHEIEKLSNIRKTIARRLTESKQQVPHIYLTVDVRLDALLKLRGELNKSLESRGVKLSVNDLLIKALGVALEASPKCNVTFLGNELVSYKRADVSVAVSTPTGLITPIIKDAANASVSSISTQMKDLAGRAKEGKLKLEEFQGGGFTISNLGMFGVKEFAAIINPPQAMILAVGVGEERVVARKGEMVIRTMMSCTLAVDHRVVDGAMGAQFLQTLRTYIEQPAAMLV